MKPVMVNWKTDMGHSGQFVSRSEELTDKIRLAWAEHNANYPTCTLCDVMEVDEEWL